VDQTELDNLMQTASAALLARDYLTCEERCMRALAGAREREDWAYYGRVLLPLQEARRHRRTIASEGAIRLGTTDLAGDLGAAVAHYPAACIVVTHPRTADDARALATESRRNRQFIEVLFADNAASAPRWTLRGLGGTKVTCELPAPPAPWIDRWLDRSNIPAQTSSMPTPGDWFLDATEALGDRALAQVKDIAAADGRARLAALEQCLDVVTDHELIHQYLWDAARVLSLVSHR
jgi:hypothetical protein